MDQESRLTKTYIRSLNGVKITFRDIKPQQIRIDSILLHLAKSCRYNGMVDGFYSNAEHSILCSERAINRTTAQFALIHDFGEHITNDVPAPVKRACPDYKALCEAVQASMYLHFMGTSYAPPEVKIIDSRMSASEMLYLRHNDKEDLEDEPYPVHYIHFNLWEWRDAYCAIKCRFHELFPDYKDAV